MELLNPNGSIVVGAMIQIRQINVVIIDFEANIFDFYELPFEKKTTHRAELPRKPCKQFKPPSDRGMSPEHRLQGLVLVFQAG